MSVGYALRRLFKMNFSRAFREIRSTAAKCNKPSVSVLADMMWCGIRYGAGPSDYELFEFYNLTGAQRKTYITRGINNALVKKYNDKNLWHLFDNKNEFNELFKDYIHRDWLVTEKMNCDELEAFLSKNPVFIYKPVDGTCGRGIEKVDSNGKNPREIYEYLKSKPNGIIEQIIVQHDLLSEIYPLSINTVRVVTILKDGEAMPVFAFWRIGNNGKFVDNLNSGGMAAMLDIETGRVKTAAQDKDGITYEKHPFTGKSISGFTMPMWDDILALACNAAKLTPSVGYVGWDVALSRDGIQLIEGNCFPGHDILQLPAYTPNKIGLKPRVDKFL